MNNETPAPVGQSFQHWHDNIVGAWKLSDRETSIAMSAWVAQEANIAALKAKLVAAEAANETLTGDLVRVHGELIAIHRVDGGVIDALEVCAQFVGVKTGAEIRDRCVQALHDYQKHQASPTLGQSIAERLEAGEQCFKALGEIIREPICEGDIERGREAFQAYKDATSAPRDGKKGEL